MTRRPMDGARRNTSDTAEHAARGGLPATDYGADAGEPIYAPFAGRAGGWWSDTGGNTVQVVGGGVTFVGQHLSLRTVPIGAYVNEGDLIGYVGSTGRKTDGPHLHWWIEDHGVRISGETYMYRVGLGYTPVGSRTPNTSSAGDSGTIIEEEEQEEDSMYLVVTVSPFGAIIQKYLVTSNGLAPIDSAVEEIAFRVMGSPKENAYTRLYPVEAAALDERLRATASPAGISV